MKKTKNAKDKYIILKTHIKKGWTKVYQNRKYILIAIAGIVVLHMFLLAGFIFAIDRGHLGPLPEKDQLKHVENPLAAEMYTADSVLMGTYYLQNRMDLDQHEITEHIITALIAAEDIRYYRHNGIDVRSLFRVLIKTILLQRENSGGGSTITQQLAKNLYPRRQYPMGSIVINKLREMIIAVKLEQLYSKREILMLYLNTVPFGEDTYGIKSGALRFFHKNPAQLHTEEIALLVGMLKGSSYYNPRSHYERALNRRNVVLHQMNKYGYLEETKKDSLSALPIQLNYYRIPHSSGIAPYFRSYLRPYLRNILNEINEKQGTDYHLDTDGLKIYTTIDSRLQSYAEIAVEEHLKSLQKILDAQWGKVNWERDRQLSQILNMKLEGQNNDSIKIKKKLKIFDRQEGKKDTMLSLFDAAIHHAKLLHAGFLVTDNRTGEIKAWVGGINQEFFQFDQVMARRQVGSTFKPFVYLAALEGGYSPCDMFDNQRHYYTDYDGWSPGNSDNKYEGIYSLKGALTHSVNTVSAKLITEVGVTNVIETAKQTGIETDLPKVPSIALGTAELSLFEMVSAYQTLANKGKRIQPMFVSKIEDRFEKIIYDPGSIRDSVMPVRINQQKIETLIEMMKNVVNRGTAIRLRYKYHIDADVAGKTGTTQNYADGWFIGFTPEFTAGARVGTEFPVVHFKNKYGQGANTALPIWAGFFQKMYADVRFQKYKESRFSIPDSVRLNMNCNDYIEPPKMKFLQTETMESITVEDM